MAIENSSFRTQRTRVLQAYKEAEIPFDAGTKPYKSTLPIVFEVVEPHPTAAPTMAHAVARRNANVLSFFGYGLGDAISSGAAPNATRISDESDTNLSKAKNTNGAEDFIIESVSCTRKAMKIAYPVADGVVTAFGAEAVVDQAVNDAYTGIAPIYDPGSLASPPQFQSPFNLEDGLFEILKPLMQFTFEFDRRNIVEIGTLDEVPEGGAKSFLRSSGDPRTDNRYKVPEGYLWRKEGQTDSEFVCRLQLRQDAVVPISLIAGLLGLTPLTRPIPTRLILDITLRVHGLSVAPPTKN